MTQEPVAVDGVGQQATVSWGRMWQVNDTAVCWRNFPGAGFQRWEGLDNSGWCPDRGREQALAGQGQYGTGRHSGAAQWRTGDRCGLAHCWPAFAVPQSMPHISRPCCTPLT